MLPYVASFKAGTSDDLIHFGVKGMKWGVLHDGPTGTHTVGRLAKHDLKVGKSTYDKAMSEIKQTGHARMWERPMNRLIQYGQTMRRHKINELNLTRRKLTMSDQKRMMKLNARLLPGLVKLKLSKDDIQFLVEYGYNRNAVSALLNSVDIHPSDYVGVGGAMATRDLLMSDLSAPENYAGVITLADVDLSHHGVKGMKWGIRNNNRTGNKTHAIRKFEKPHGKEQRKEARKGTLNTGSRSQVRQAITESAHKVGYNAPTHTTTVAALQAHIRNNGGKLPADGANVAHHDRNTANLHVWKVGRPGGKLVMSHMATFQQMTPNGKIRKVLRVRPGVDAKKVMDSLNLERVTSADLKKTAIVNLKASPGQKIFSATQSATSSLAGTAVMVKTLMELNRSRATSKSTSTNAKPLKRATQRKAAAHSSLALPQDYVGAFMTGEIGTLHLSGDVGPKELEHFGVKGMKWGVRHDPSAGPRPTLARAREDRRVAKADQVDAIRGSRASIASGATTVVRGDKILSTKQALRSVDKEAERLSRRNPVVAQREAARKLAHEEEQQKTLVEAEHQIAKFNRLEAQLKAQGVHSLLDDELKFVNSRNEAMKKAKDVYNKPSWLRSTLTAHAKKIASEALLGYMTKGFKAGEQQALVGATRQSMKGFNRGQFSKSKTQKLTSNPAPKSNKVGSGRKFDRSKYSSSTGTSGSYTRGGPGAFSTSTALVRAQPVQNYAPRTGTTATGVPIFNVTSLR